MNKLLLPLLLAFLPAILLAERLPNGTYSEWGKVTMEELKMSECSFEKKADAMMLDDLAHMSYKRSDGGFFSSGTFRISTAYYQRYKVFTERGTSYANKKIRLSTGKNELLINLKAISYNLINGEIKKTELQPADIHTVKNNDGVSVVSFTVPSVTAATVFEISYDREVNVSYTMPRWYFSSGLPIAKSSLTVDLVDAMIYYINKHVLVDSLEEKKEKFTSGIMVRDGDAPMAEALKGVSRTYTAHNVKSYSDEPYINSHKNYMSWISFQLAGFQSPLDTRIRLVSSFTNFATHFYSNEIFLENLDVDPISGKEWMTVLNDNMSKEEKAHAIYDYIRKNMTDNGLDKFESNTTNAVVWKNKTGCRTEINMLLISALRHYGINAEPMLVGDRDLGEVNMDYPMLDDYSGIDALVTLGDGKGIVLDATDRTLPFGEPPFDQLNTTGLVMKDKDDIFWYDIKEKKYSMEAVTINATLDESGTISGTIEAVNTNHNAEHLIRLKKSAHQGALNQYLKEVIPAATIESSSDTIQAEKCYFTQKIKFSMQPIADNDGNIYLSVPGIYSSATTPFTAKDRLADIDFGFTDKTVIKMTLHVPASYQIDSVFKPTALMMPDTSISFANQVEASDGVISWQQKLEHNKSFYKAAHYSELYDFEKRYFDIRQRPVVIKKKA